MRRWLKFIFVRNDHDQQNYVLRKDFDKLRVMQCCQEMCPFITKHSDCKKALLP